MTYKTTIEIMTDAEDKNEAMEIAGEYLSGNIISGVGMRCHTRLVNDAKRKMAASVLVLSVVVVFGLLLTNQPKNAQGLSGSNIPGINAMQPPLKTYVINKNDAKFKKEWQERQNKEALGFLKK